MSPHWVDFNPLLVECDRGRVKEYYIWFLILQTGMLGVHGIGFLPFFVFWEAMLVLCTC